MSREQEHRMIGKAAQALGLILIVATLSAVVFQDIARPLPTQKADVEQAEDSDEHSGGTEITVVQAVQSSVHVSVVSEYFLIDILPLHGSAIVAPLSNDVLHDSCLKLSRILFRRIISPNAP